MTASQAFLIRRNNAIDLSPMTLSGDKIKREIAAACQAFDEARNITRRGLVGSTS